MKNILIINIEKNFECDSFVNISDGTNRVFTNFYDVNKPTTVQLLKNGQVVNVVTVNSDVSYELPNEYLAEPCVIGVKSGERVITLNVQENTSEESDLIIYKNNSDSYRAEYHVKSKTPTDLKPATRTSLGGVIIGEGVDVDVDGRISVKGVTVDDQLNITSTNSVQNKVITAKVNELEKADETTTKQINTIKEGNFSGDVVAGAGTDEAVSLINTHSELIKKQDLITSVKNYGAPGRVEQSENIASIDLGIGNWLLIGYNGSSNATWLNGITDMDDNLYMKINAFGSFAKVVTLQKPTTMFLKNLSGNYVTNHSSTCLMALKLNENVNL